MGLIPFGIDSIISGVGGIIKTVAGDKSAREANSHEAYMSSHQQAGQEFMTHLNRSWFDSLIDGINRLPRPTLAIGTIGLFVYAMYSPVEFGVRMEGLALVPEPLWMILFAIIAFYFGSRELQYSRKMKTSSTREEVGRVVSNIQQLRSLEPGREPMAASITPAEFESEMENTAEPLSNAAVMEWNRRYGGTSANR